MDTSTSTEDTTTPACDCMAGVFLAEALTVVRRVGEFHVDQCRLCGQHWLCVEHEEPAFSRSGEWYRLPFAAEQVGIVTEDNGLDLFEQGAWYWAGGSLYDGRVKKQSGKLKLADWL